MIRLRLTAAARADLIEIRVYGVQQFGRAADSYFRRFRDVFALLREHPEAGAIHAKLDDQVRSFTHRRHRIFYRVTDAEVKVLRIIHHAREISPAMLSELH